MSLFNSFWNYRINVCRLLTTVERHICIQLSVCSLKLLQWNLWTSLSLICSLSVFPRSLTLSNSDTVQMKSGSRRWRMHGLTRDTQSGFTLTLQHVQKAWQNSAHHWESTNRLHGNSSLASAHTCHTASPPRMPLGWYPPDPFASFRKHTSGSFDEPLDPGRFSTNTHTHAHTRTELMKHENLKSQHVMPLGFFLYSLTFIQTGKLSIFQEEIAFAATAWGVGEAPFSR